MTGIAYQYALAVFSLAKESGNEEKFLDELKKFADSLDESTEKFFIHPKIEMKDKVDVLNKAVKDHLLGNFLKVLVENDRFMIIKAVVMAYQDILDNIHKVMNVMIFSNKPLTETNIVKIKNKLSKTYNRTIEVKTAIDDKIIGGFRIEFEGNIIDETINRQLDDMRSSLLE